MSIFTLKKNKLLLFIKLFSLVSFPSISISGSLKSVKFLNSTSRIEKIFKNLENHEKHNFLKIFKIKSKSVTDFIEDFFTEFSKGDQCFEDSHFFTKLLKENRDHEKSIHRSYCDLDNFVKFKKHNSDNSNIIFKKNRENDKYSLNNNYIVKKNDKCLNECAKSHVLFSTNQEISEDLLFSIARHSDDYLFTQLGLKRSKNNNKDIINLGLGYRRYSNNRIYIDDQWMYGINFFYDYDYCVGNNRISIGGEGLINFLKITTNVYLGLTGIHATDTTGLLFEKVVSGFDISIEAYLPKYSQVSISIKYEKYFNHEEIRSSLPDRRFVIYNPNFFTLGFHYTSSSLISFSGEKVFGDKSDIKAILELNYQFGAPISDQIDKNFLSFSNFKITRSKLGFINRSHDFMVRYYRVKPIRILMPKKLIGEERERIIVPIQIDKSQYGFQRVDWEISSDFVFDGGNYRPITATQMEVRLPHTKVIKEYNIYAIGVDDHENKSNRSLTIIRVNPSDSSSSDEYFPIPINEMKISV